MGANVPNQAQPEEPATWIIDLAVDEIRHLAGNQVHRQEAAAVLPYWKHAASMTTQELALVLNRFPLRQPLPEHHGYKIGGRHPDPQQ